MVWDLVRVSIFTAAFLVGMTLAGSGGPFSSAGSSQTSAIAQMDENVGMALVIACDAESLTIRQLSEQGAIQFDCTRSTMMVVRDHNQVSQKQFSQRPPELRLLRHLEATTAGPTPSY